MKKYGRTILATATALVGLFTAGTVSAHADTTYRVVAGDCVWAISQQYGSTIEAIETRNNISGHLILPGQELTIPGVNGANVNLTKPAQAAVPVSAPTPAAPVQAAPAKPATPQPSQPAAPSTPSYTGNNMQSYVLSQMESRTGVSAATWNHIINRESNWQPNVVNSTSGAYGLFQNMHISGGNVQQQIDAAVNLYHVQGMQAWAL